MDNKLNQVKILQKSSFFSHFFFQKEQKGTDPDPAAEHCF